jgi:hypothetical protein
MRGADDFQVVPALEGVRRWGELPAHPPTEFILVRLLPSRIRRLSSGSIAPPRSLKQGDEASSRPIRRWSSYR